MTILTLYDRGHINKRIFEIYPETCRFEAKLENVLYYSVNEKNDKIVSIDPDGGPYIHVGMLLNDWTIIEIVEYVDLSDPNTTDTCEERTVIVKGKVKMI